ncbi:MAG: hypothetical protein KIS68_12625 [Bauldia sp.]|nr:hypothetical protein [Bauldia sp.]
MSEETLSVRVPLAVRKRGGRKVVLAPDQAPEVRQGEPANWTLVKNLARAFRWQRMVESGDYATIGDLATAEGVTGSYVSRILRLTLLSPEIALAILRAQRPEAHTLPRLARKFPLGWDEQAEFFEGGTMTGRFAESSDGSLLLVPR